MSMKISTWLKGWGREYWLSLARSVGILISYAVIYFSVGLPVGIGFFVYARVFLKEQLREVPLHMEDSLLFLHAIAMLLLLVTLVIIIAFMLRWLDKRGSFFEIGIRAGKNTGLVVIVSLVVTIALAVIIYLVGLASGQIQFVNTAWEEGLWSDILTDFIGYFVLLLTIAFIEELLFRGYIRHTLGRVFSPKITLVISALLFAISRMVLASSGWLGGLNALLSGMILGMLFLLTGSLWAPIAVHFTWIFIESFIFSFPSPGVTSEGLLRIDTKPGLLLDGSYGPQGGLVAMIIFLVVAVGLWLYIGKRRAEQ